LCWPPPPGRSCRCAGLRLLISAQPKARRLSWRARAVALSGNWRKRRPASSALLGLHKCSRLCLFYGIRGCRTSSVDQTYNGSGLRGAIECTYAKMLSKTYATLRSKQQVVRLLLAAADHHQRFTEVRLRFASSVRQGHEHLSAAQLLTTDVILHDRVAAGELCSSLSRSKIRPSNVKPDRCLASKIFAAPASFCPASNSCT
jgi:hypothetical protein